DAAAVRVGVHEEGAQALPGGGEAEGGGEDAGSGAAAGADHAERGGPAALRFARGGELVDQPVLVVGEDGDVLRSGLDRQPVGVGGGVGSGDEDDSGAALEADGRDVGGRVGAHEDEDRPRPGGSGLVGAVGDLGVRVGG